MNLMEVLALVLVFLVGVDIGGRWAGWVARKAVRRAGFEWEFQRAVEQLKDPSNWRDT